ncbi:MAG: hypothetical protein IKD37_09420 [Clostridia bacterium]|nr:hypothetical protein [Clostridia bacterium]
MNTIKIDKKTCLMVAHRGCSGLERENTNAAFVAAGNRSYWGIETDIHYTADGKYILYHDNSTPRLCIDEMVVEKTTFDTLRSLTLIDLDGKKGRSDLRMPTLEEYIGICKKYEKVAVLELKNAFPREQVHEICAAIEAMDYLQNTVFIAFSYENLVYLREKYPTQPAQFLTKAYTDDLIDLLKAQNLDLDIRASALTEENVAALKAAGIRINCWTVNDPEEAERLIAWGVDYITTNILE